MSTKFSCKGCDERYVGCHSTCEKYIQEKIAHNAAKEAERAQYSKSYRANTNGTYYSGKNPRKIGHHKFNI